MKPSPRGVMRTTRDRPGTRRPHGRRRLQRAQQLQRIAVTVERAIGSAGDSGPRPGTRYASARDRGLRRIARGIPPAPAAPRAWPRAARALCARRRRECRPAAQARRRHRSRAAARRRAAATPRRALRPGRVLRKTRALPLHPDQPEIAARRAIRNIAFIEERELRAQRAQAERDAAPTRPRADTATSKAGRRSAQARIRKSAARRETSAPKSSQPWLPPPATYWNAPA